MIRLSDAPSKPYWIDLPHGVRLLVNPLTTAVYEAARARGRRLGEELMGDFSALGSIGGRAQGVPDIADPDALAGISQMLFTQALARMAITAWEGVADGEGNPAPVTGPLVDALMRRHDMADAFLVAYQSALAARIAEGNV